MDHQQAALAIRYVHVAAMATVFGGAFLVTWIAWRGPADRIADIAIRYEQLFWGAAGVLVMTGVGNLGALGPALPAPGSAWGATFLTKLLVVALLVAISLPRSLAVIDLAGGARPARRALRTIYGVTTGALAVVVALALQLAHG
ncbi:MAG: hypothetical protein QOH08_1769 [Chloroflexota bacterium]|nr:hypothetical protein [Chloroflexota bacterium]